MESRFIPYNNQLAQAIFDASMRWSYRGGHEFIFELIKKNLRDEAKKNALKCALQVRLCINVKFNHLIKGEFYVTYDGNFYHYAISQHLNKHLELLNENDLIPEKVLNLEGSDVAFPIISPLVTAVRFKNYSIVKKYLVTDKYINECDKHTNQSLLAIAAEQADDEMVELLLKYGTNPNSPNYALDAALSTLVVEESKRTKVVKLLINYGANVLLDSIQEKIKNKSDYLIYDKEIFYLLEKETKERSTFRSNISSLLFFSKNRDPNNNSVVRDVPKEIFNEIIHSIWVG